MARVIKGGGAKVKKRSPKLGAVRTGKVIDREAYQAQQKAAAILESAEEERKVIAEQTDRLASQAREEAQVAGATEAFAELAVEGVAAFRRRAEEFAKAAEDIRLLAQEIVLKIAGHPLELSEGAVDKIIDAAMAELRARRRLRIQLSEKRYVALQNERPRLMTALDAEPDLLVEQKDDVGDGFARVVTEVGGALCSEQAALDALADAVNVDEAAVAPTPKRMILETQSVVAPSGTQRRSSSRRPSSDGSAERMEDTAKHAVSREQLSRSQRRGVSRSRESEESNEATAMRPHPFLKKH